MHGLWAVAKYTFRQCLRMKVAGMFIILLALVLAVLPFVMKGDGTLAGRVRTFLAYGVGATAALLSLVTIFLGAGLVSNDVRGKQIFSITTKPVARWQYILGRWLGLVLLNTVLLALAGAGIYGLAQYLRAGEALNPADRRAVETEVFTARREVSPQPLDIEQAVRRKIERMHEEGRFAEVFKSYLREEGGDESRAREELYEDLYEQESDNLQSVAPGGSMTWRFEGIDVVGQDIHANGTIVRVFPDANLIAVEAGPRLLGRITWEGPVTLNGVEGQVKEIGRRGFVAAFPAEAMVGSLAGLDVGDRVALVAGATIQLTYEASPSASMPNNQLTSIWEVYSPSRGYYHVEQRTDATRQPATMVIAADAVGDEGQTEVTFYNTLQPVTGQGTSVTVLQEDINVLFKVGGFSANFARGLGLIWMQLAFLAALAVMAGSFVSFAIACLICFAVLPIQIMRTFLLDAVRWGVRGQDVTVFDYLARYVVRALAALLPDFGRTTPGERLVDGMVITWASLGTTAGLVLVLQAGILLALACLVFHKRELARVQV